MTADNNRVIALAGVFQAAFLASQIANSGSTNSEAMLTSIESLFKIDADSAEDVFGGTQNLRCGLHYLYAQLGLKQSENIEITQYVIALLHLERKLEKNPEMQKKIYDEICISKNRLDHFHSLHENIIAQLADIYSSTISTLRPRIMIQGNPLHLQNNSNASQIRALLLAGIRSAMLWRQCGGGRFQIIMGRKKLALKAQQMLAELS